MKTMVAISLGVGLVAAVAASLAEAQQTQPTQPAQRRGFAVAQRGRPESFPHRIWAANDFEVRLPDYGWFGAAETKDIPKYPGNVTALRGRGPYEKFAGLMVGMNPVPGPMMGTVNQMYCRYRLVGATEATFQHFSLSSSDNCNIRVSGLAEGEWSEATLNFTRDSRRNDGSPGAFKKGERMDDLKIFVGKGGDGKTYEMVIDDVIFFATEPDLPPETEPFPNRVIFLAAFDTGVDAASRAKFFPGEFEVASGAKAPKGSYWSAAKGVAGEGGTRVRLDLAPPRHVGANTKLRFRYWVKGASAMKVVLHDATANADRTVELKDIKQGDWATQYATFSQKEEIPGGGKFPTASKVDRLDFVVSGEGAELYVDEVVLFDAKQ